MAFGIIRARNLSAGDISSSDKHNARRYSSAEEYPENIKVGGKNNTIYLSEKSEDYLFKDDINLQEVLDIRLKENNVKGIKKNSNVAIEYVCSISDKSAWDKYSFEGFVSNTQKWLEERHGEGSVIASYDHQDESNPHVHFIVVPLIEKDVKWKNKNGEGKSKQVRLNTRPFTGGKEKLRALQDDYYNHLVERYGAGEDNSFGVPLYRGTLADSNFKKYSQATDHEIGALREELRKCDSEVQKIEKELEIARKQAEFVENERKYESEKKRRQESNKHKWKFKGTKDLPNIFHSETEKKEKPKRRGFKR